MEDHRGAQARCDRGAEGRVAFNHPRSGQTRAATTTPSSRMDGTLAGEVPSVDDVDTPTDLLDDREASGLKLLLPPGRQGPGDPELEAAAEAGSAVAGLPVPRSSAPPAAERTMADIGPWSY